MKTLTRIITVILVVFILFATTSCTQQTCPTYARKKAVPTHVNRM